MADAQFEPGGFFQFDMAHGSVRSRGGSRVLLLSEEVLAPLIVTAVNNGDLTAVRAMGSQLGEIVARGLPGSASTLAPEVVVSHAANVVSLFGWGRLRLERWGEALVLAVDGLPPLDEDNLALAALLGGMFSTLCKVEVACVPLSQSAQYLVVDPSIAEHIWAWSKSGESLSAIVGRLGRGEV